jgi:hypothetical protein
MCNLVGELVDCLPAGWDPESKWSKPRGRSAGNPQRLNFCSLAVTTATGSIAGGRATSLALKEGGREARVNFSREVRAACFLRSRLMRSRRALGARDDGESRFHLAGLGPASIWNRLRRLRRVSAIPDCPWNSSELSRWYWSWLRVPDFLAAGNSRRGFLRNTHGKPRYSDRRSDPRSRITRSAYRAPMEGRRRDSRIRGLELRRS